MRHRPRLGELLIEAGLADDEQIQEALESQKSSRKPIGQILIDLGYLKEGQLLPILGRQFGCSFAEVSRLSIPPDALRVLPKEMLQKNHILPIRRKADVLTVAMPNPLDLEIMDVLRARSHMKIEPVVAQQESVDKILSSLEPAQEQKAVQAPVAGQSASSAADRHILEAIERNSNCVHFEPHVNKLVVKVSAGETLEVIAEHPKEAQDAIINRVKILSRVDTTDSRLPLLGSAKLELGGYDVDLTTDTCPVLYGERAVVRIRRGKQKLLDVAALGFTDEALADLNAILSRPNGLIIVAGPKGSGKTTTLSALLEHVGSARKNPFTIEDPVEFELEHVNQIELNRRAGLDFQIALDAVLKQNPDIVGLGKIPPPAVVESALVAAANNCLVALPVPAGDPAGAIGHVFDLGVRPFALGSALACIISQRLVKRLCDNCKQPFTPDPELLREFRLRPDLKNVAFFKATGCEKCRKTGFWGHAGILAVLTAGPDLKRAILEGQSDANLREIIANSATGTLEYEAVRKLASGVTSVDEARRVFHPAATS